ncbi:MAG: alpha/beta fold hydrolase [Phenylobacterium sp.]
MARLTANGIEIEYDVHGPEGGEPIVLVMGLGAQMIRWSMDMVGDLAGRGYRVVRFDNRDVGLSHRFDDVPPPSIGEVAKAVREGRRPEVPYFLSDMAADAAGVIDGLGFGSAHVVGASMGGMIAQMLAAEHPHRVRSMTSIMSSTGNPGLPPARPEAVAFLVNRGPDPHTDLEAFLDHGLASARVMAGPAGVLDEAAERAGIEQSFRRAYYPVGFLRQYAAILGSGDRRESLRRITAPTVVIHGADDPLVPVEGGYDTAACVPGAEMHVLEAMGHNIPAPLIPKVCDLIERAVRRAA